MSLEYLESENQEGLTEQWEHVKKTQKLALGNSHWACLE